MAKADINDATLSALFAAIESFSRGGVQRALPSQQYSEHCHEAAVPKSQTAGKITVLQRSQVNTAAVNASFHQAPAAMVGRMPSVPRNLPSSADIMRRPVAQLPSSAEIKRRPSYEEIYGEKGGVEIIDKLFPVPTDADLDAITMNPLRISSDDKWLETYIPSVCDGKMPQLVGPVSLPYLRALIASGVNDCIGHSHQSATCG